MLCPVVSAIRWSPCRARRVAARGRRGICAATARVFRPCSSGAPARHRWTMSAVANDTHVRGSKALRRALFGLQGFTLVGVVAGVHGFLTGAFEPLVAELVGHL